MGQIFQGTVDKKRQKRTEANRRRRILKKMSSEGESETLAFLKSRGPSGDSVLFRVFNVCHAAVPVQGVFIRACLLCSLAT